MTFSHVFAVSVCIHWWYSWLFDLTSVYCGLIYFYHWSWNPFIFVDCDAANSISCVYLARTGFCLPSVIYLSSAAASQHWCISHYCHSFCLIPGLLKNCVRLVYWKMHGTVGGSWTYWWRTRSRFHLWRGFGNIFMPIGITTFLAFAAWHLRRGLKSNFIFTFKSIMHC